MFIWFKCKKCKFKSLNILFFILIFHQTHFIWDSTSKWIIYNDRNYWRNSLFFSLSLIPNQLLLICIYIYISYTVTLTQWHKCKQKQTALVWPGFDILYLLVLISPFRMRYPCILDSQKTQYAFAHLQQWICTPLDFTVNAV